MKIKLTENQIGQIKERLSENRLEFEALREKDKVKSVSGWDFASLSNEKITLEDVIKTGEIDLDNYL